VLRNTGTASRIALLSMMSHSNEVSHNVLSGGDWGMDLFDSHFNRYTDNRILFAEYDGILLDDSNGNTLLRNDTLGPGDDGLDVHGGSNGNTIIGTVSNGHADNGIELENRTHENVVANSKAHGNAGCDIVNHGALNVFQNNEADCTYGF
jgi:parallel beta-helix repeat protein